MEKPRTTHPHLASIGESLDKSMQRHVINNDAVHSAFAELAFELELVRSMAAPSVQGQLEPTI